MPKTILIIDDEPAITVALMTRLQAAGYQVFHAINGLAGVEAASLHKPDVIILDVRMPDIDGYEACKRIRAQPDFNPRIIFLSAQVPGTARKQARLAGGDVFLSKPYTAADVLDAVESDANAHTLGGKEKLHHV